MKIIILSSGLKKKSKSRALARFAYEQLKEMDAEVSFINMQDYDLPFCDAENESMYHPRVVSLREELHKADALIVATPVYNYNGNSTLKNVMELTGAAWRDKVVGFLCAAGGEKSYMSIMSLANNLMLDFRCLIIPKFVYATDRDFDAELTISPEIKKRITEQNKMALRLIRALK